MSRTVTSARCFFWMPLLCKVQWAPCNGTTSTPPNFTIAHYNSTLQWHPAMAPHPLPQSWSQPPLQWHLAMAPRPLPKSWPFTLHHSTLQWHPAMTPSNGTTSTPPKLVAPCPPTIAHYSGTLRWHTAVAPWCDVHSPKVSRYSPPNLSTLQRHPTMARPLHPAMAPWCHVQSAKVVRRPPPYWR